MRRERVVVFDSVIIMAVAMVMLRCGISLSGVLLFIPAWIAFRLYWFWWRAKGQGLFDD